MPVERLRSPFHLSGSPESNTPVSSRTRSKAGASTSRRRRLQHAFDDLPWISTLDASPDLLNPWDIADLSLLADSTSAEQPLSSTGPGPVRRRKTLLRTSPIAPCNNSLPCPPHRETFTPHSVSTPRSRFIPSRVLFHNLMPVVSCDFRA